MKFALDEFSYKENPPGISGLENSDSKGISFNKNLKDDQGSTDSS